MRRNLLARLRTNGTYYIISALLLLLGIPLYQLWVLVPTGFSAALNGNSGYFAWIGSHSVTFLGYRALLLVAFVLLWTLPFSLYRIIVAQEIMGQQEREAAEQEEAESEEEIDEGDETESTSASEEEEEEGETDGMPAFAWRGKGFAVLAAWSGILGIGIYLLGAAGGTFYLVTFSASASSTLSSIFTILTDTIGFALLALSALFFGSMIVRAGRNLWPGIWVAFGWAAFLVTLLLAASAVATAGAPVAGQNALATPATFLLALWVLWFGIMLVRLKPEA